MGHMCHFSDYDRSNRRIRSDCCENGTDGQIERTKHVFSILRTLEQAGTVFVDITTVRMDCISKNQYPLFVWKKCI